VLVRVLGLLSSVTPSSLRIRSSSSLSFHTRRRGGRGRVREQLCTLFILDFVLRHELSDFRPRLVRGFRDSGSNSELPILPGASVWSFVPNSLFLSLPLARARCECARVRVCIRVCLCVTAYVFDTRECAQRSRLESSVVALKYLSRTPLSRARALSLSLSFSLSHSLPFSVLYLILSLSPLSLLLFLILLSLSFSLSHRLGSRTGNGVRGIEGGITGFEQHAIAENRGFDARRTCLRCRWVSVCGSV